MRNFEVQSPWTDILQPDDEGIARAAEILDAGGIVAFPTETVYGLGGDARNSTAVRRIYEAKGRPEHNPLIIHFADADSAMKYVDVNPLASELASEFWPGPLTLVLPILLDSGLSPAASAKYPTLGVRVPSDSVAMRLLGTFAGPVAAPSANRSGAVSPTEASHVLADLSGRINAVIDGGPCRHGIESTIVSTQGGRAKVLRHGAIPEESIIARSGQLRNSASADSVPVTPGQMASHYAPRSQLRLNAAKPNPSELWLAFGPGCDGAEYNLSDSGNLAEAAANLFALLRSIDEDAVRLGKGAVAVSPIPPNGLGVAINDRLSRAAHSE